jgi:hypothetical protein
MKKLSIIISLLFVLLAIGAWLIFQKNLEKENESYALELKKRQVEIDKTKKTFAEQIKQEPDWKPLGGSQSTSTSSSSTGSRTFLGRSQTGYELWADKNCVYVKGMTEADLARLHTNVWSFKDEVKAQTSYKCVLFE